MSDDTAVVEVRLQPYSLVDVITAGPTGPQGPQGEPGRGVEVFESETEPTGAQPGDVWLQPTDLDPSYPTNFTVFYLSTPNSATWPHQPVVSSGSMLGGYNQSPGDAVQRDLVFRLPLQAGAWKLGVHYRVGPNLGNLAIVFAGVEHVIDTFLAGGVYVSTSTILGPLTIAETGTYDVIVRAKGTKNAASVGTYLLWTCLTGAII